MYLVLAMVGWVCAWMEVVDSMHAGQSKGVGRMSGDVRVRDTDETR